ncbi:MAG: general secretion pathway protein GspK, partial [bacterium]|nr:general secretion pathway protein GspK [bacterium]
STAEKAHGVENLNLAEALADVGPEVAQLVTSELTPEQLDEIADNLTGEAKAAAQKARAAFKKDGGKPIADAEEFLMEFLERVVEHMGGTAAEKEYDLRELARNLLDYLDFDETRIGGGKENFYYRQQDPPYLPANKPLLSVRELGLIEGFDHNLVEALEPYLTVYPLFAAEGVNLNTAPRHVLGSIWKGTGGSRRLLSEDDVVEVLDARARGVFFCDDTSTDPDRCLTLAEADIDGELYPPTQLPARSWVFTVVSQVIQGDIERTVEAVINMTQTGKDAPFLLYWRLQ